MPTNDVPKPKSAEVESPSPIMKSPKTTRSKVAESSGKIKFQIKNRSLNLISSYADDSESSSSTGSPSTAEEKPSLQPALFGKLKKRLAQKPPQKDTKSSETAETSTELKPGSDEKIESVSDLELPAEQPAKSVDGDEVAKEPLSKEPRVQLSADTEDWNSVTEEDQKACPEGRRRLRSWKGKEEPEDTPKGKVEDAPSRKTRSRRSIDTSSPRSTRPRPARKCKKVTHVEESSPNLENSGQMEVDTDDKSVSEPSSCSSSTGRSTPDSYDQNKAPEHSDISVQPSLTRSRSNSTSVTSKPEHKLTSALEDSRVEVPQVCDDVIDNAAVELVDRERLEVVPSVGEHSVPASKCAPGPETATTANDTKLESKF